jgi:hypothetical protein
MSKKGAAVRGPLLFWREKPTRSQRSPNDSIRPQADMRVAVGCVQCVGGPRADTAWTLDPDANALPAALANASLRCARRQLHPASACYLGSATSLDTFSTAAAPTFCKRARVSTTVGWLLYWPRPANGLSRESRAQAALACSGVWISECPSIQTSPAQSGSRIRLICWKISTRRCRPEAMPGFRFASGLQSGKPGFRFWPVFHPAFCRMTKSLYASSTQRRINGRCRRVCQK